MGSWLCSRRRGGIVGNQVAANRCSALLDQIRLFAHMAQGEGDTGESHLFLVG